MRLDPLPVHEQAWLTLEKFRKSAGMGGLFGDRARGGDGVHEWYSGVSRAQAKRPRALR